MENDSRARSGDSTAEGFKTNADEEVAASNARRDEFAADGHGVFRQPWIIISCLLIVAAAVFLLLSHTDAAFVSMALGVSAWFWNMRVRLKRVHNIKSGRRAETRHDDED